MNVIESGCVGETVQTRSVIYEAIVSLLQTGKWCNVRNARRARLANHENERVVVVL